MDILHWARNSIKAVINLFSNHFCPGIRTFLGQRVPLIIGMVTLFCEATVYITVYNIASRDRKYALQVGGKFWHF